MKPPIYTWAWHKERTNFMAVISENNYPTRYKNFPMDTEPNEMATWAKAEIQKLKLSNLLLGEL